MSILVLGTDSSLLSVGFEMCAGVYAWRHAWLVWFTFHQSSSISRSLLRGILELGANGGRLFRASVTAGLTSKQVVGRRVAMFGGSRVEVSFAFCSDTNGYANLLSGHHVDVRRSSQHVMM